MTTETTHATQTVREYLRETCRDLTRVYNELDERHPSKERFADVLVEMGRIAHDPFIRDLEVQQ
jgi:hypothetical protein